MPTHDEVVSEAVPAANDADRPAIIRAFVGSLSTRNLPARSAFGSLMVLQNFKKHPFRESTIFSEGACAYCGLPEERDDSESDERVEVYPFQVQHTDIQYAAYDLSTFPQRAVDEVTQDSVACLQQLLDAIRSLPASAQLTELNKSIAKAFKSNKLERMILLETLGYAGILCPKSKQHYGKTFVTYDDAQSDQPKEFYKQEWEYPVRFWTGRDGVNEAVVRSLFGKIL